MADSQAEAFKQDGRAKEFIDENGNQFILIQFSDKSGVVLKKEQSDGELSVAKYTPEDVTKEALSQITGREKKRTRTMINEIIEM